MKLSQATAFLLHITFTTLHASRTVDVTCKSKRVTSFQDKLSTSWVLSYHNVTGVRHCAVYCQTDVRCMSFVYSDVIKDCRLYAVVKAAPDMDTAATGYHYYDTCRGTGYYGASCTSTTQCLLPQTRCFQNACRCEQGYSFNVYLKACVATCPKYGPEFEPHPNYFINGNNDEALFDISEEACLTRCRTATNYTCRSVEYRSSPSPACSLASVTKLDVPKSDWVTGDSVGWTTVHYQRHCSL